MNRRRHQRFFPRSVPMPERLARWNQCESYECRQVERYGVIDVVRRRFSAADTEAGGRKIAFISDLHHVPRPGSLRTAADLASALNATQPDLLLLGGDAVGDAETLDALIPVLSRLAARVPAALAVPGNWERGKSWIDNSTWDRFFAAAGFRWLNNAFWSDDAICVYGMDDLTGDARFAPPPDSGHRFNLLLAHSPDTVLAFDQGDNLKPYRLAMTGHTHGGQLRLPGIGALLSSSRYGRRLAYGVFRHREFDTALVVSSGTGHLSFPWRFHCRRELVLIELIDRQDVSAPPPE